MTTGHQITYLLNLPEQHLEEIRKFLDEKGAKLDIIGNIAALNEGAPCPGLLMGADTGQIVQAINQYMRGKGSALEPLPEFDGNWPPRACEYLLTHALCMYQWDERNRIEYDLGEPDPDPDDWEKLLGVLRGE